MSQIPTEQLRTLIAEAVREAVAALPSSGSSGRSAPSSSADALVTRGGPRSRTVGIRLMTDEDLADFVRRLLVLFENPKTREDLRNGWLRFSLAGARPSAGAAAHTGATVRIERGVLTERQVAHAAETGQSITVAAGAVITPLARDKARSLGVHIDKERR